jgi:sugar phosphate isomerase/epimerase
MTRREMLASTGAALAWLSAAPRGLGAQASRPTHPNMGGESAGFRFRGRLPGFDMYDHCRSLGFGAVRLNLSSPDLDEARALRRKAEDHGMRLIISLAPPDDDAAVAAYEASVRAVAEMGAVTMQSSFTARRYEQFDTFEAFKANFERCQRAVERAEPILRRYRMRLAIENHKGWRAAEHAAWIDRMGSEWIGATYDVGNNMSLCEDPAETYRLLGPRAIYVSFKDMAVEPYDEGFLLSEMALGDGMLDLPGIVTGLQARDPNMIFALEMITRDPLKIPVFTDKYWVTFDSAYSPLPGRDLARMLEIVRNNPPKTPLTRTSGLTPEEGLALEDDMINRSIAWAAEHLAL